MAIARHYQTTVTTSATAINGTQYPGWILFNNGADTLFLGGDNTVTTGTGFPIAAQSYFSAAELSHKGLTAPALSDRLFGIAAATTRDVRVIVPGKDLNA